MFYDYRDEEIIQDVILEDITDITADIYNEYHRLRRNEYLAIYCPVEIAKDILGNMLEYFDDVYVAAESDTNLLHDDEDILLTLAYDGEIFIENAFVDGRIIDAEAELTYIYDSFKQEDVERLSRFYYPVLVFGFKDEFGDDGCNGNCNCCPNNYSSTTVNVNGRDIKDSDEKQDWIEFSHKILDAQKDTYDKINRQMDKLVSRLENLFL